MQYASKDDYLENFQAEYRDFVESNSLPEKNGNNVLIKYFANVEKVVEKPVARIPSEKYYIWTRNHVKDYMSGKNAYIWILRIYALKEPYWAEPTPGAVKYANLHETVSLEGMKPVLSDSKFAEILQKI